MNNKTQTQKREIRNRREMSSIQKENVEKKEEGGHVKQQLEEGEVKDEDIPKEVLDEIDKIKELKRKEKDEKDEKDDERDRDRDTRSRKRSSERDGRHSHHSSSRHYHHHSSSSSRHSHGHSHSRSHHYHHHHRHHHHYSDSDSDSDSDYDRHHSSRHRHDDRKKPESKPKEEQPQTSTTQENIDSKATIQNEVNTTTTTTSTPTNKPNTPTNKANNKPQMRMYMPPSKLREMQKEITDKNSAEYQRLSWEALKKSINALANKVSASNIKEIVPELFRENLERGRGLFCRTIITAQHASPNFTPVYAALVAIVNTRVQEIGELLLHRLVDRFNRAYRRNNRDMLITTVTFIAHLLNQQVCTPTLALEICVTLLESSSEDGIEVAAEFIQECGYCLKQDSAKGFTCK